MTPEQAQRYRVARQTILKMLPKGGVGAEIGVWQGDFSARILSEATPARLHLIDPWQTADDPIHETALYGSARGADMEAIYKSVVARFQDQVTEDQIAIHRATASQAMARIDDASLDFVYIDGDHAYEAVRADLELAWRKVRTGGLVAVDDYAAGKWWGDDVIRATNEFIGTKGVEAYIAFALSGQVALVKRGQKSKGD